MKGLYLLIDLASISIPFLCNFHPRLRLVPNYWAFVKACIPMWLLFLVWDVAFVEMGVWAFNTDYLIGLYLFGLPIEEYLFFFCIPFASLYIHFALERFASQLLVPEKWIRPIVVLFVVTAFVLLLKFWASLYTRVNMLVFLFVILIAWYKGQSNLRRFLIAFAIILLPFFIVNGLLTGSGLEAPIVWYNDAENMGIRLWTIPLEDLFYAFSMLFMPLLFLPSRVKVS